ncbi:hypothetical protein RRG08_058411 [Elysia crispata]|uniref:ABC transporter domain-containing protein n=1 Tax=Elysia crispata TaxID=231223 RepID=A0AAE0XXE6_9GAST|nr:hypothetical protein RRG08_058411 [Elysia crispata]
MIGVLAQLKLLLDMTLTCFTRMNPRLFLGQLGVPLLMMLGLLFVGPLLQPGPRQPRHARGNRYTTFQKLLSSLGDNASPLTVGYTPNTNWTDAVITRMKHRLATCGANTRQLIFQGYSSESAMLAEHNRSTPDENRSDLWRQKTRRTPLDIAVVLKSLQEGDTASSTSPAQLPNTDNWTEHGLEIVIRPRTWGCRDGKTPDTRRPAACRATSFSGDRADGVSEFLRLVVESIVHTSNPAAPNIALSATAIPHPWPVRKIVSTMICLAFLPGSALLASYFRWRRSKDIGPILRLNRVSSGTCLLADVATVVLHTAPLTCCLQLPLAQGHVYKGDYSLFLQLIGGYGLASDSVAFLISTLPQISEITAPLLVIFLNLLQMVVESHADFLRHLFGARLISCLFSGFSLNAAVDVLVVESSHGFGQSTGEWLTEATVQSEVTFMSHVLLLQTMAHCLLGFTLLCLQNSPKCVNLERCSQTNSMFACTKSSTDPAEDFPEIEIRGLSLAGDNKGEGQGLTKVSFNIQQGETVAILGPPMAGKTTLAKVLTGQITQYVGDVLIKGVNPVHYLTNQPDGIRLCPQHNYFYETLTVKETFIYFSRLNNKQITNEMLDHMLSTFLLDSLERDQCGQLSTSGVKKLQLAIACMALPQVIVLDEPTQGMGETSSMRMTGLLRRMRATTVVCTSSASLALQIAARVVLLVQGQVLFDGTGEQLNDSFGAGYFLSIGLTHHCSLTALSSYLRLFVPGLYVFSTSPRILTCILPDTATSRFEFLLANLDWKRSKLRVGWFTIQHVTMENLLEWLPDSRCLRARLRQIAACKEVMEEFRLDELLRDRPAKAEPVVIYSKLKRSQSSGDIYYLHKELNRLCINNSNSTCSGLWDRDGAEHMLESCVDPFWCCEIIIDALAINQREAATPVGKFAESLEDGFSFTDVGTLTYSELCNFRCMSTWLMGVTCYKTDPGFFISLECCVILKSNLNSTQKSDPISFISVDKQLKHLPSVGEMGEHFQHMGFWFLLVTNFCDSCYWRLQLFSLRTFSKCDSPLHQLQNCIHLSLAVRRGFFLGVKAIVMCSFFTTVRGFLERMVVKVLKALVFFNQKLRDCKYVAASIHTLCKNKREMFGCTKLKTLSSILTWYRKSQKQKRSNSAYFASSTSEVTSKVNAISVDVTRHPLCIACCSTYLCKAASHPACRECWWRLRTAVNETKTLHKPRHLKYSFAYTGPTNRNDLLFYFRSLPVLNSCRVTASADVLSPPLVSSEFSQWPPVADAMDRNQSANPDIYSTAGAAPGAAVQRTDARTSFGGWNILTALTSKFKARESQVSMSHRATLSSISFSKRSSSRWSSFMACGPTVPFQATANLEDYLDAADSPQSLLLRRRSSLSDHVTSWRTKLWHAYIALQGKLLLYTLRAPVATLLQMVIPLSVLSLSLFIHLPTAPGDTGKLALEPCQFAPIQSFVEQTGRATAVGQAQPLDLGTTYRNVVDCQNADHVTADRRLSLGVVISRWNRRSGQNICPSDLRVKVFHDCTSCFSQTVAVAALLEAYYRCYHVASSSSTLHTDGLSCAGGWRDWRDEPLLRMSVQPLPGAAGNTTLTAHCARTSIALMVALSCLVATFVSVLVKERVSGFYHLQGSSEASCALYFCALSTMHLATFTLSTAVGLLPLSRSGSPLFLDMGMLSLVLGLYALASLPQIYTLARCFRDPLLGVLILGLLKSSLGTAPFWTLQDGGLALDWSSSDMLPENWMNHLLVLLMVPSSGLSDTLYRICQHNSLCSGRCSDQFPNWMIFQIRVMLLHVAIWSILLLLCESDINRHVKLPSLADIRRRLKRKKMRTSRRSLSSSSTGFLKPRTSEAWFSVMGLPAEPNIPVVVENVWTYSRESQTNILKGVCFKVAEGGCFGILGAPGAGKSTLLKILVGLSQPSQGTVTLSPGASSARSPRQDTCGLTFCLPCCDLMPVLTGRETLTMLGWLRGVASGQMRSHISFFLDLFGLTEKVDNFCSAYSKTDRVKILLCAALIGNPRIVVLDLPSEGLSLLDISALGQALDIIRSAGGTVVLATEIASHGEALCSDIGVLRAGALQRVREVEPSLTIGVQGSRFCQGYVVHMMFRTGEQVDHRSFFIETTERIQEVEIFLDDYGGATFHFLGHNVNLAKIFALMEDGKLYYGLGQYAVIQADLGYILDNTFASQGRYGSTATRTSTGGSRGGRPGIRQSLSSCVSSNTSNG